MIETSHKLEIPQTDQRDSWIFFRIGLLQLRALTFASDEMHSWNNQTLSHHVET